jgi:hypothetical protein
MWILRVFDALITTEKLDIIVENYELGNSFKCNYCMRFYLYYDYDW